MIFIRGRTPCTLTHPLLTLFRNESLVLVLLLVFQTGPPLWNVSTVEETLKGFISEAFKLQLPLVSTPTLPFHHNLPQRRAEAWSQRQPVSGAKASANANCSGAEEC